MLLDEIDLIAGASGSHIVRELHWGGGTPNILAPEDFRRILNHLKFWFDFQTPFAHAVEIDPRHLSQAQAETYAACDVTRVSVGVQTLARHVQHAIGRIQSFDQVTHAVTLLRSAGVNSISFDLMYGLPEQSLLDVLETIALCSTLKPDRIALFGYAHVPWFKPRQRVIDAAALPDARARYHQAEAARRALVSRGYVAIGMDHFAMPDDPLAVAQSSGTLHRNFQGYVASLPDAVLGLGPSAISTLPQGYVQNAASVGAWRRMIESAHLPVARGHAHSADDIRRGRLIEQLMCDFTADLRSFGGRDAFARELEALSPLAEDGLVVIEGERLLIPESMRPFCRLVARAFDTYVSGARHSHTI
jgi:oxygen-independent coproporphyrinogen-3 oxidase